MLSDETTKEIHSKILDTKTQDASAYDPDGLESLNTYVSPCPTDVIHR